MDELSEALHRFSVAKHNHTIVFGHYPLITIADSLSSRGESFGDLSAHFSAYLCGHLHTLYGRAPRMHARHFGGGMLELEVPDYGWAKGFRIFAFDHDLISFIDTKLDSWPVLIITNPKDAMYLLPEKEPFHRIGSSSHIRILAFSPEGLASSSFEIEIDGQPHPEPVTKAVQMDLDEGETTSPLYVARWNPEKYSTGLHTITVSVMDKEGKKVTKTQQFSVDGTTVGLYDFGALFLSLDLGLILRIVFLGADVVTLALLLLPKMWVHHLNRSSPGGFTIWRKSKLDLLAGMQDLYTLEGACSSPLTFGQAVFLSTVLRFAELSQYPSVLIPTVGYGVYILFFPWFIGRFVR